MPTRQDLLDAILKYNADETSFDEVSRIAKVALSGVKLSEFSQILAAMILQKHMAEVRTVDRLTKLIETP